jgi:hypothetical protein
MGQECLAGLCGCPAGGMLCSGRCVNLAGDSRHCGSCNKACSNGTSCSGGKCVCRTGLTACPSGCVNLATDDKNCGACSSDCKGKSRCSAGSCERGNGGPGPN